MKHTALIFSGDARFSRFLVTELGYLGVEATVADDPELLSGDGDACPELTEASECHLLVVDGDTCSAAVRSRLAADTAQPILTFACLEKNRSSINRVGPPAFTLRRPFSIAEFDSTVRDLLSLDGGEGVRPLPHVPADVGDTRENRGEITITHGDRIATVQGHNVPLTATESTILAYLLSRRGELVSREALAPFVGGGNSVDVYVCRLRRKLEKPLGIRLIHTVRGEGYRLA